jgi:hypothetical protein
LSEYLEEYLSEMGHNLSGLDNIGEEISDRSYETRQKAQAVADRFEAFAIEAKLAGEPDVGTVAAEVLPDGEGWIVKAHYLSPAGKTWRASSIVDDGEGLNE